MRTGWRLARASAVFAAAALVGGVASAQPSAADKAAAEALFREGKDLLEKGRFAEACPKLADSQRLDAGIGTLLYLADCYEKNGQTASAWATFLEAASAAKSAAQSDRERIARERAAALEGKLSRLVIAVPAASRADGLVVKRGATTVVASQWGSPVPVDPGKYTVEASAPGRRKWTATVEVRAAGKTEAVTVPALASESEPAAPARPTPPPDARPAPPPASPDVGRTRPVPVGVYVAGGATIALAAGATVTGLSALARRKEFNDANGRAGHTDEEVGTLRDRAVSMGLLSTILTGAAVAGAGVTAYLYASRPERGVAPTGRPAVSPWVGPGLAGISLVGGI